MKEKKNSPKRGGVKEKKKAEKIKWIKPAMKFNIGKLAYEPVLSLRKRNKNQKVKFDWWALIILLILLSILLIIFFIALKMRTPI
jgi:hypothetical protein